MPNYNIYYTSQFQRQSTARTLLDQLQNTGSIMGSTNHWPSPRGFFTIGVLVTGSGVKEFQISLWGCFVLNGAPHNTGENPSCGINRRGGGNVGMTRGLFATMLERADTKEAIGLSRSRLRSTRPIII